MVTTKGKTIRALLLGALIAVATIVILLAINANTSAVQAKDYHACIIAVADQQPTQDADRIAQSCHAIVYGEEQ